MRREIQGHGHQRDVIWFGKEAEEAYGSMGDAVFVARVKFKT